MSAVVLAPAGSPARRAAAIYRDDVPAAWDQLHPRRLLLRIDDAGTGETRELTLVDNVAKGTDLRPDLVTLRFAPDGRSLAFTLDPSAGWSLVHLGFTPFVLCRHRTLPPGPEPSWRFVPAAPALAREFASTAPVSPGAVVHVDSAAGSAVRLRHFAAAVDFARSHPAEAALRRAIATTLVSPWLTSEDYAPLDIVYRDRWLLGLGDADTEVRAAMIAALESPPPRGQSREVILQRASYLLTRSTDAQAQDLIAGHLLANGANADVRGIEVDELAWALAEVTERRRAGSDAVRRALEALAPPGLSTFNRSRYWPAVQAVRALCSLGDARARAVLAAIAAPACEQALTRWPTDFSDPHQPGKDLLPLGARDPELSCWARAALTLEGSDARAPRPRSTP